MKIHPVLKYLLLACLLYMPLFGHLDALTIRIWDEARLAQNAWEMLESGDLIVTRYAGEPEMWNTKPPMMIWIQVLFIKLIGYNEIAIRLPSALAALFTCFLLLWFSERYLKSSLPVRSPVACARALQRRSAALASGDGTQAGWPGIISALLLICIPGYVMHHGTRTGDYDALLTFFTTASAFTFFAITESGRKKYIYMFFAFLACAVLTKGVAGLLITPAFLIYALLQKKIPALLKEKHFYAAFVFFLLTTSGYYLLREHYNPGYLKAVWENEIGGRYLKTHDMHYESFWFYFSNIIGNYVFLFILIGFFTGILSKNRRIRSITYFSAVVVLAFLLVISLAKTKLYWYDMPVHPFLALIIAIPVFQIFSTLEKYATNRNPVLQTIPFLFLILAFIFPYMGILDKTYHPRKNEWEREEYNIAYFLRRGATGEYDLKDHYIGKEGYTTHLRFYVNMLQTKGIFTDFKYLDNLRVNDRIIVGQPEVVNYIRKNYLVSETIADDHVIVFKIHGRQAVK